MATFNYKGFTLIQEEKENHHYMIFKDGRPVLHASYYGKLFNQKDAEIAIERHIYLCEDENNEL